MSDDNDEKKDLTRIENLADFLHDEEEDFSDLETYNAESATADDDSFGDQATDPSIELPPEFNANEEDKDEDEEEYDQDSSNAFSNYGEEQEDMDSSEFGFSNDFESEEFEDNFKSQEEPISDFEDQNDEFVGSDEVEPKSEAKEEEKIEEIEEIVKTPLPSYEPPQSEYQQTPKATTASAAIESIQTFAKNVSYGDLTAEGNPPFSIVIKNIKYKEDVQDIVILLSELKVIDEKSKEHATRSLERGSMLIPRLSEFAAITICHKLRRFHLNLLMGLSDEVHPPKEKEEQTISKKSIYGDYSHSFDLGMGHLRPADVMTTTTTSLEGYEIVRYLGVVSESTLVDMDHFSNDQSLEIELLAQLAREQRETVLQQNISSQNKSAAGSMPPTNMPDPTENSSKPERITLNEIYSDLAQKLKPHAITFKGNAIVGINYAVTPIIISDNLNIQSKYQITCTGSVVWAVKN